MKQRVSEEMGLKRKVWLSVCLICILICSACTVSVPGRDTTDAGIPQTQDTLLLTPDFSYEVVQQIPNIRIDCEGYPVDSRKTAYFIGDNLDTVFSVIVAGTTQVVYEGNLKAVSGAEDGKVMYTGDFTSLISPGSYRIYHPQLGYSYEFQIDNDVYQNIAEKLYQRIEKSKISNVENLSYILGNLMLSHEIFTKGEDTGTTDFITERISWLLETTEETTGHMSLSATAAASGALAQYYCHNREENPELSNQCLKAAEQAYQYVTSYRDSISSDSWYYAVTELYRATGGYQYKRAIAEYDQLEADKKKVSDLDYTLLADMAYLLTNGRTDYNRCNTIMQSYMEKASDISENSTREYFYVLENVDTIEEQVLFRDMMILGVVNYVLSGREYAAVQENYIHYFFGVNGQAVNRLKEAYQNEMHEEPLVNNMTRISEFLFILGYFSSK